MKAVGKGAEEMAKELWVGKIPVVLLDSGKTTCDYKVKWSLLMATYIKDLL